MAIPAEQIESIIKQLHSFGDDGMAFDAWMDTVSGRVRAHGHVGAFRTEARALWLSNNKKGVEKLVRDVLGGPNHVERAAQKAGELTADMTDATYVRFLTRMGICQGDTLSVHTADGDIVALHFDNLQLPKRERKKPAAKKPAAKKTTAKKTTAKKEPELLLEKEEKPAPKKRRTKAKKNDDAG